MVESSNRDHDVVPATGLFRRLRDHIKITIISKVVFVCIMNNKICLRNRALTNGSFISLFVPIVINFAIREAMECSGIVGLVSDI